VFIVIPFASTSTAVAAQDSATGYRSAADCALGLWAPANYPAAENFKTDLVAKV
jgi:hypothetical protein